MRLRVRSLALFSGLRIRHCCELWCRLQMQLGPSIAVTVVQVGGCSSNYIPSLGTSRCHRCSPRKDKKKKKRYKRTYSKTEIESKDFLTKLKVTKRETMGGGINQVGINLHTLLYIKQIDDKDLRYSTGESIILFNNLYVKRIC